MPNNIKPIELQNRDIATTSRQFHFLLADDDQDDRFFFSKAIKTLFPETKISYAEDGAKLVTLLNTTESNDLPDVLFLDLNMPKKNGSECLREIRADEKYRHMIIIIYSTSSHESIADVLYNNGADFYVRKPDLPKLSRVLQHILSLLINGGISRPERDSFVLKVA